MLNCPVCDTEYTEGSVTCSHCSWIFNGDEQQIINWARQIWIEKRQLELKCQELEGENKQLRNHEQQVLDQQNLPALSESQLNNLQEELRKTIGRVYQLEQSQQPVNQFSSQIEDVKSQLEKLNSKQESKEKSFSTISQEIANLKEEIALIKTNLLQQIRDEQTQAQEQLLQQIQNKQAPIQNRLIKIEDRLDELDELSNIKTRLDELEEFGKAKQKVYGNSSPRLGQGQDVNAPQSQTKAKQELSWEEHQLVKEYNENLDNLSKRASEVSETEKSISERRMSSSSKVIFEEKRRGNYLILKEGGYEYLVPSNHLRINQHNYKTVEALFECRGFQPGYSEDFQLFKPAKVSAGTEGRTWQLDEPGILQF